MTSQEQAPRALPFPVPPAPTTEGGEFWFDDDAPETPAAAAVTPIDRASLNQMLFRLHRHHGAPISAA